ncbi:MAG: H/ACA ribonucleoprotein complex subunit GAR1 [Halobacteriota archaeon]
MRRLGTLERLGQGKGLVALEADELPAIGADAVDQQLQEVGTVVDVIGPVDRPWVVLDPVDDIDLGAHLGARLYVREDDHR